MAAWYLPIGAVGDGSTPHQTRSGGGPGEGFLVETNRSNRGWVDRTVQMPEDLRITSPCVMAAMMRSAPH